MRFSKFNLIPPVFFILWLLSQASGAQTIVTVAGNGINGNSGDGGPATLASFSCPDDIALDSKGNLYIADACNLLIRKVDMATGVISTVAGDGTLNPGYTGDGGPATLASFNYPSGLAFDSQDNLYISDYYNEVVRKVDATTGIITTVVGSVTVSGGVSIGLSGFSGDGGPATLATLNNPLRLKFDSAGDLLIADSENGAIRKVNMATGIITTIAGTGVMGYSGDGGPATLAQMAEPQGMDFDLAGNLYVTDSDNHVVRKINISTGIITTFAGTGGIGYTGDGGAATLATMSEEPDGILVGCGDNVYVTDDYNNVIRMVSGSTGNISTFAGAVTVSGGVSIGISGYSGDGGPPFGAEMSHPEALIYDKNGNIYEVEYNNAVVRKINTACVFTPTPTSTNTATATNTATKTMTPTPTNTPTVTPTPTETWTNTFTNTPTNTNSNTPTNTPTPTFTNSPTPTPTGTPTNSFTDTNTPTNTETNTPTTTPTNSFTSTNTGTPTNSFTFTHTATDTDTTTSTNTPTKTDTFTPTNTPTNTPTSTWTPTPTWGVALGKSVSKSKAQSGDTLAYTLAVTVMGNQAPGLLVTDPLPSDVSFVGIGTVTSGTAAYNAATSILTWTLASPLPPGAYGLNFDAQVRPMEAGGTNIVNRAQLNAPGFPTTLSASVTVLLTGDTTVRVGIYNEAGELVKTVLLQQFSQAVNDFTLSNKTITALTGSEGEIILTSGGVTLGTWDGMDSKGTPVSNGTYLIKLDNIDSFGAVTSITRQAMVSRSPIRISAVVYNEAGEAVRHLYVTQEDASNTSFSGVVLNTSVLQPGKSNNSTQPSLVQIRVETTSVPLTLVWDGTSDSGAYVSNGYYHLVIYWTNGQGGDSTVTRGVMVVGGGDEGPGTVTAKPNPVRLSGGAASATFKVEANEARTLRVKIYTLAGELVAHPEGGAGTNQASWDASRVASGMYLAEVEVLGLDGKTQGHRMLKVAVLH